MTVPAVPTANFIVVEPYLGLGQLEHVVDGPPGRSSRTASASPGVAVEGALDPKGVGVPEVLGQLPAVLALDVTEQPAQVVRGMASRLQTANVLPEQPYRFVCRERGFLGYLDFTPTSTSRDNHGSESSDYPNQQGPCQKGTVILRRFARALTYSRSYPGSESIRIP